MKLQDFRDKEGTPNTLCNVFYYDLMTVMKDHCKDTTETFDYKDKLDISTCGHKTKQKCVRYLIVSGKTNRTISNAF